MIGLLPGEESQIFLDLMFALDSAFSARQGLGNHRPEGWGEKFFSLIDQNHPEWSGEKTRIYMVAGQLLHYFSLKDCGCELGAHMYRKPEAFLRSVLMLLEHDQPTLVP